MSPREEQLKQLQFLQICPKKLRKDLLKRVPTSSIKTICECALNVLKGNIPLSDSQKSCLRKHKNTLRRLSDKKSSLFKKRKLIIQRGGFLNVLVPAAITLITSLLNGVR